MVLKIADGVASEAGLGLAMRLFNLESFQILYEEKLQTKVGFHCFCIQLHDIWFFLVRSSHCFYGISHCMI